MKEFDYVIPEEIKSKISDELLNDFYKEIREVYAEDLDDWDEAVTYIMGTFGWSGTLQKVCERNDSSWLWDYYDNLAWYDSDLFDSEFYGMVEAAAKKDGAAVV